MDITALLALPTLPGPAGDPLRPAAAPSFDELFRHAMPAQFPVQPEARPLAPIALQPLRHDSEVLSAAPAEETHAEADETPWPIQTLALMASLPAPVTPVQQTSDNAPVAMPVRHEQPLAPPTQTALAPVAQQQAELEAAPSGTGHTPVTAAAPALENDEQARAATTSVAEPAAAPARGTPAPALPAPPPAAPASATPALALAAPLGSSEWPQELGRQLVHFATGRQGEQRVTLQLNPAHLGPMSVNLTLDDQTAQAQFFSAHAPVRTVLEQAIPQLREALAEQGIQLGEASVGEERQRHGQPDQPRHTERPADHLADHSAAEQVVAAVETAGRSGEGRVDLYA